MRNSLFPIIYLVFKNSRGKIEKNMEYENKATDTEEIPSTKKWYI